MPVVLCTEAALKQLAGLLRAADARDVSDQLLPLCLHCITCSECDKNSSLVQVVMIVDEADSIWANISEHKVSRVVRACALGLAPCSTLSSLPCF